MSRSASPVRLAPRDPSGLFNFDDQCVGVTDADEEILELYMDLAQTSPESHVHPGEEDSDIDTGGLGFFDSSKAVLELEWDLVPPILVQSPSSEGSKALPTASPIEGTAGASGGRRRRAVRPKEERSTHIEVKLSQDLNLLKASRGDTGSVLWRSSYYLAQHVLTQHHFPPIPPAASLLDPAALSKARVLELGAGTGLLSILLRGLCFQYTVSDRWENLKLIKRNLELNKVESTKLEHNNSPKASKTRSKHLGDPRKTLDSKEDESEVLLEEIDWVAVSEDRRRRQAHASDSPGGSSQYDLVLCVDCIFNEHLIQPLVDTLAHYCPRNGKTVVWIVAELRSSDVMSKFLETWLGDSSGPWTLVRLSPDAMGRWDGRKPRWVGWVGWR